MTRVPRFAVSAVAVSGLLLLAGCGSGLKAQTYSPKAGGNYSDASDGAIAVRNVYVAAPDAEGYAQGANADVVLSIASRLSQDDRLVSATTPAATRVEVPTDLVVPADGLVVDRRITLLGLNRVLRSSDYVFVTFAFESGASIETRIPVAVTTDHPEERPGYRVPETDSNGDPLPEAEEESSGVEDGTPAEQGTTEPTEPTEQTAE